MLILTNNLKMKPVVVISNNINVKEGFEAINKEFAKNQELIDSLEKLKKDLETKGLSEKDFTKALKDLLLSLDSQTNTIELDLKLTDKLKRYKELSYDINDNITELNIYDSLSKNKLYYNVAYSYTGQNITLITVKRISDNYKYTKTLEYDVNDNLISININKI